MEPNRWAQTPHPKYPYEINCTQNRPLQIPSTFGLVSTVIVLSLRSISGLQLTKQSQKNWWGDGLSHKRSCRLWDEERLFPRPRQYPRRPWTENPQSEPGNRHEEVCAHTPPLARRSTGHKAPQVSGTKSNGAPPSQVHTQTLGRYQRRRNDLNLLGVPLQARIPEDAL